MLALAVKMFIGNRASCLGVIFGIFLATLLISQQSAIFLGLLSRAYRIVTDISAPDIWVMDPATQSDDKVRGMPTSYLSVVRSTPGIAWAMPINTAYTPLVTPSGGFEICALYGIDDATLVGAPTQMVEGSISDLRREGGVIVDVFSAKGSLAKVNPEGKKIPLKIGDSFEINHHRAVVVGLCKITQGFYPQPIIFTTYSEFLHFNPGVVNRTSFIAAKSISKKNLQETISQINTHPGLLALTKEDFKKRIIRSFLETGILINFGLSVGLGIIIGFSIAGQIFYIMTLENLMYYALIKGLGGTKKMLFNMITVQAILAGAIGFSLGMGATALWGIATKGTTLAFMFTWQLLLFTGLLVLLICTFTAAMSIRKVNRVDPKELMGN